MDKPEIVASFALAALEGGARGLRIEGIENLRAVRRATSAPIIGLVKRDLETSPVKITPNIQDVEELAKAGADIIAFDATARKRPASCLQLISAIKSAGRLAMADISNVEEARQALGAGADIVGTTMSGYTGGPEPEDPDIELVRQCTKLTPYVIAEGRLRTPDQAAAAKAAGAFAVVVGSAITRPEHVTNWFAAALARDPERAIQ
jgi:putative N-acetylmannosamine-6-phosphate epimerase